MLDASVATNTKASHEVGIKSFESFCSLHSLQPTWPPPSSHITRFVAYLSLAGYKHSTAQTYIAAISFQAKTLYNVDPTDHFIIKKLLQGMLRTRTHKDSRLPITLQLLQRIIPILQTICCNTYETKLFTAAFTLAFHAFLRIGEFALSKGNIAQTILQFQDISLLHTEVHLIIKRSKTDQLGVGTTLHIPASNCISCPFVAMHNFLQIHPSKTGPLFTHFGGQPITRYQFVATLTQCLKILGIDSTKYNSHSFRIGAATTLAMQGVGSDTIQAAGRWRSNVFRSYIR